MANESEDAEITVMVVDDHPIWREGVARDLTERGLTVVATAPDADAAIRIANATRPRVVLMDLNLGVTSGVTAIEGILEKHPETRILVLSASGEHTDVLEAVKAGASGYLVKSAGAEELLAAVRRTAAGHPVFTPGLAGLVLGEYRRLADEPAPTDGSPAVPALTERETEVLRLVAKGLTAKQIGDRLVVSHRTVESHVQNTLRKLQLHNRAQLVRYAIEQGLAGLNRSLTVVAVSAADSRAATALTASEIDLLVRTDDVDAAADAVAVQEPQVVVVDMATPDIDAVDVIGRFADLPVLSVSGSAEHGTVLAAVRAGAAGYLVGPVSMLRITDAVRRLAAGEAVYSPGLAELVLEEHGRAGSVAERLTEREADVLRLVVDGFTGRQIAARLVLSPRTVENHVQNTLRKVGVPNRAALVRYAIEHGLA